MSSRMSSTIRLMDIYLKQRTAIKNKIHGEKTLGIPSKAVYRSLNRTLRHLKRDRLDRRSFVRTCQRRSATAINIIEKYSRNGSQDSFVLDSGDRWF